MKKIILDKEEGIAEAIERVLAEEDADIALVIPKGSVLGRSAANFHLLKREADAAEKSVAVESVDEHILAFAKGSGLDANHPLWRGVRGGGGVSDIIPSGRDLDEAAPPEEYARRRPAGAKKAKAPARKLAVRAEEEGGETEDPLEAEESAFEENEERFFAARGESESGDDDADGGEGEERTGKRRRRGGRKALWWAAALAAAALVALGIATFAFGRASVTITFQKTPWNYAGNFVADKSAGVADAVNGVIPAQVFSAQKNMTELFPASGSADVSIKASGTITIYNDYSARPQELVARTRFLTPDGKLYRLVRNVIVPGASVSGGKLSPSSIQAVVAADQPGPAYNSSPVAKLTIPGFKGMPQYDGFYGALLSGASGGASGMSPVPTAADITAAKTKMTSLLQAALAADIASSYPNDFKILDGATQATITRLMVNTTTDSNGQFSVFGEANLEAIGFNESMLRAALLSLAQSTEASSTWASLALTYSNVRPDFAKGILDFTVSASGSLEPSFSTDVFGASIAGESLGAARTAVGAIPRLANGEISVWPVWLWRMPSNPAKIEVTAD